VIKLIQITDTHLTHPPGTSFKGRDPAFYLEQALRHSSRHHPDAQALLLTGDLVHDNPNAYDILASLVTDTFHATRAPHQPTKPVLVIAGNHDLRDGLVELQRQLWNTPEPIVTFGAWTIIGVDSTDPPHTHGTLSESELTALSRRLAAHQSPHALVALHHPPLPIGSKWMDEIGLTNADAFWSRLHGHPVRGVVHGHIHQPFLGHHHEIPVWGTPSSVWQFKAGNDYGLDPHLAGAYRWLELKADGTIDTDVVWV